MDVITWSCYIPHIFTPSAGVKGKSVDLSVFSSNPGSLGLGCSRRLSRAEKGVSKLRQHCQKQQTAVKAKFEGFEGIDDGKDEQGSATAQFEMDWRTFRAKLVAGKQAVQSVSCPSERQQAVGLEIWQNRMSLENWALLLSQNPRLAKEVPWAHALGGPEEGGIVLASPSMAESRRLDERYWQSVVFLMRHRRVSGVEGSWGLILNRPSGYTIQQALAQVNQADASLSVFGRNAIYIGGFRSDGQSMYFLHGHDLPGAEEIMPGVFMGGLDAAAEEVLKGTLPASDFRFFVGRVDWQPGTLEKEVEGGLWFPAACARSLVLKQCIRLPKPLWREVMELMGGEYADTARREYGEK